MMWLSHTTMKFLDSDLKFSKKNGKKAEKEEPVKDGKADPKADPKKNPKADPKKNPKADPKKNPKDGQSKEASGLGPVVVVDNTNGTLHANNGDVLFIKNGIVVA